jgi:hypothetical protein
MMRSEEGVKQATASAASLIADIDRLAKEAMDAAPGLHLEVARQGASIGIRSTRASVLISWHTEYSNVLEGSYVFVALYRSKITLPGEKRVYIEPPKRHGQYRFLPERVQGLGWCWKEGKAVARTSSQLADHILALLLEEVRRGS